MSQSGTPIQCPDAVPGPRSDDAAMLEAMMAEQQAPPSCGVDVGAAPSPSAVPSHIHDQTTEPDGEEEDEELMASIERVQARMGGFAPIEDTIPRVQREPDGTVKPESVSDCNISDTGIDTGIHSGVAVICVGMAGAGKTSLLQRLNAETHTRSQPVYLVNLDPAVLHTPYEAHIDVRQAVDYKQVMKTHGLGPNGAIMTALNLYATKWDQALNMIERRASGVDYILVDTPGQIEVFTWSASGHIITESIAATIPTVLCFVVDTPRCTNPTTFMSSMLYAASLQVRSNLPMVIVFSKTDVTPSDFAIDWMQDFEALHVRATMIPLHPHCQSIPVIHSPPPKLPPAVCPFPGCCRCQW